MTWEYRTVTRRCERNPECVEAIDRDRLRELNPAGAEGWELVTVVPVTDEGLIWAVTYVFKRPGQGR